MKRFNTFVQKELFHILRDWRTLLILIGMPIVQVLLFGFAISNEINEVNIIIADPVKSENTRQITQKILSSQYFKSVGITEEAVHYEREFRRGNARQVIVFDRNFEDKLNNKGIISLQVISDASDPNTATLIKNYTFAIVSDYIRELNSEVKPPMIVDVQSKMLYNPQLKGVYLFVPGTIAVILMLISAMMTSISITKEKELGTMEVLLATPMSPALVIISKVVPYIVLSFLNAVIILLLGFYVFDVPIMGSLPLLLAETFLFVITALALGIFISSKTNSQQVALMVSLMGLMLPTILLSGFIFPVENMPAILQWLSNIVPARWFIIIIKGIMLKGIGLELLWKETLILVGFAVVLILMSIKNFKLRLE